MHTTSYILKTSLQINQHNLTVCQNKFQFSFNEDNKFQIHKNIKFKISESEEAAKHNECAGEKSVNTKTPQNKIIIARCVKTPLTIMYHYLKKTTNIICRKMEI